MFAFQEDVARQKTSGGTTSFELTMAGSETNLVSPKPRAAPLSQRVQLDGPAVRRSPKGSVDIRSPPAALRRGSSKSALKYLEIVYAWLGDAKAIIFLAICCFQSIFWQSSR